MVAEPGRALRIPSPTWEPPPVRRPTGQSEPGELPPVLPAPDAASDVEETHTPVTAKRGKLILTSIIVESVAVLGGIGVVALIIIGQTEDRLFNQALVEFREGRHKAAADQFRRLVGEFPTSERLPKYEFLAELSQIRASSRTSAVTR